MQRSTVQPRPNWQKTVEAQGFVFHTAEDQPYWDESHCYRFTSAQIDVLEKATYELDKMCLEAVEHVIAEKRFAPFQISEEFIPFVTSSWERDELTIYGRFDLSYDGAQPPKLLEYNADTPTSLLEAAVIQWYWFKDAAAAGAIDAGADQFNSIHEKLIDAWKRLKASAADWDDLPVYFSSLSGSVEDYMTATYLRDTATQAGLQTRNIDIERIGWNRSKAQFVDEAEATISRLFKLYPWEWMLREPFAPRLLEGSTRWLEPPWKMLLSNKAILPILWEMFPGSPYLLPASFTPMSGPHVRKPTLGREGANVQRVDESRTIETPGQYGGPWVYQALAPLPAFEAAIDGRRQNVYPVIGSWMVNGYACGIGIREDNSPVTQYTSRFIPHYFVN